MMPEFNASYPPEWNNTTFGEFATLQRGKDLPVQSREDGPFPILGSNGICGYHKDYVADGPGVVTGRSGSIGGSYYIEDKFWPLNTALWVIDFHGNHPLFVHYFFQAFDFARFKAGVSVPTLNRNLFSNEPITIPLLPEQRTISTVLAKIQEAIATQQEIIDRTRELKRALMAKLFTEGLRGEPTKETEIGPVPKSWDVVSLKDVAQDYSGGTPSKQQSQYWEGSIPWASPKDMKQPRLQDTIDHISEEGARNGSRIVPAGTLFIVIRGMILAKNIPICLCVVPMAFNQDMKALVPKSGIDGAYLLYAMRAKKFQLETHISSAGHGTKRIGTSAIQEMKIPLPPENERNQIVSLLTKLDEKLDTSKFRLTAYQDLFKSMLHQLMTGSIRTTSLTDMTTC